MKLQKILLFVSMLLPATALSAGLEGLPNIDNGRILLETNDAGEKIYSDDVVSEDLFQPAHHKYFHYKLSFEEVTRVITPEVEDAFDLFQLCNNEILSLNEDENIFIQKATHLSESYCAKQDKIENLFFHV